MASDDVCLLTGQPGSGKSTLCQALQSKYPEKYSVVSVGGLIRQLLSDRRSDVSSEADLRRRPTELVSIELLREVHERLFDQIAGALTPWVLVDSHAVSQDWYGFRSTPDGPDYFARQRYSAVIQLYLEGERLLDRLDGARQGRWGKSVQELSTLFVLQAATSTVYAALSACPLYVLDSSVPVDRLVSTVDQLLCGQW